MVIFAPGNGHSLLTDDGSSFYEHIFNPLVADGFIVVAISLPSSDLPDTYFRASAMACALKWLEVTWPQSQDAQRGCDVVAMGHSRGGQAAFKVGENFAEFVDVLGLDPLKLSAVVAIAPVSEEENQGTFPISAEKAVPYFALVGGNDEDVGAGQAARAYDIMASDEAEGISEADKVLLLAYDVAHNAWGGFDPGGVVNDPQSGITLTELARPARLAGTTSEPSCAGRCWGRLRRSDDSGSPISPDRAST